MLRVKNLTQSIKFYIEVLGMKLLRKNDYAEGKFTLAFLGFRPEYEQAFLELTYNWDIDHYEIGNAYGHIAIAVDNVYAACDRIRAAGGKVTREAGPMKSGTRVLAFIEDPDGYKIELLNEFDTE